jgi:hypothetical protein
MDKPGIVTGGFRQATQESDHFVPDLFLNLANPRYVKPDLFPDPTYGIRRDLSFLGQSLGGPKLHVEPLLKAVFLGPNPSHLRARVTVNHR